jgi:hypothetical protein
MTRTELIYEIEAYTNHLNVVREYLRTNCVMKDHNVYHKYNKLGCEISALKNAVNELKRN